MRTTTLIPLAALLLSSAASAQTPRLTPIAVFGCEECAGPRLLTEVQALAVTADGRVMVADRAEPRIRIIDAQGRLESGFARSGQGPGELRLPIAVGVVGGTVVVIDMTNTRMTRYTRTGDAAGTVRLSGFATVASFPPNGGAPLLGFAAMTVPEVTLRRLRGDSLVDVRKIGAADFPERTDGHLELLSLAVAADGSFALGDGVGAYRIVRYRADGTPTDTIRRDVARVRRTPEEIQALTAQRDRNMARTRAMAATENRSAASGLTPPPIPPVRNFFNMGALAYDEHGRLWVRVERGSPEQTLFDLFDERGRYLGEVRVATRLRAFALGAGLLAGVTLDELDVPRIGVWRVQ